MEFHSDRNTPECLFPHSVVRLCQGFITENIGILNKEVCIYVKENFIKKKKKLSFCLCLSYHNTAKAGIVVQFLLE